MMLHTSQNPCYYFGSSACEPAGAETSSGLSRARKLPPNAKKVAKSGTPEALGTPLGAAKSDQKMGKIWIAPLPTLAITTSAVLQLQLLAPAPHRGGVQLELLACLCSTCLASTFLQALSLWILLSPECISGSGRAVL